MAPKTFHSAAFLALLAVPAWGGGGEVGTTSANFLKILPHARPAAMGEAYTALSDDEGALTYNPAGIAETYQTEVSATHIEWFQAIRLEHLGALLPVGRVGTLGAGVTWLQVDSMARTVRNNASASDPLDRFSSLGDFSPHDLQFSLAYASPFPGTRSLDAGFQVNVIQQNLDAQNGYGFSLDSGVQAADILPGFDIGLSLHHLGSPIQVGSRAFHEPLTLNLGLLAAFDERNLNLLAEGLLPVDNEMEFSFGGEYWYRNLVALRAGYKLGYLNQFTAGAGLKWNVLKLDYAFVPYGELGYTHRATITYAFGGPSVSLGAETRLLSAQGLDKFRVIQLKPQAAVSRRLMGWKLKLTSPGGQVVREFHGKGPCPPEVPWDGRDESGQVVPDGLYMAGLEAQYAQVGTLRSPAVDLEVDSTPPDMAFATDKAVLQPAAGDSGGISGPAVFSLGMSDPHGIGSWRLDIQDGGVPFRTYTGSGPAPATLSWDGTDGKGKLAQPGGLYMAQLTSQDTLGNWTRSKPLAEVVLLKDIHLILSSNLLFDTAKAQIKSPFFHTLKEAAEVVEKKRAPGSIVEIIGHTDNQPCRTAEFKDNQELSAARARAVARVMARLYGVPAEVMKSSGKGETEPIADNGTEEGRARNRRVEIIIHTQEYQ